MNSEPQDKPQEADEPELGGGTGPEISKPASSGRRSRTYGDATDITINLLQDTINRICQERDASLSKLEAELRDERQVIEKQNNFQQTLATEKAKLAVEKAELAVENRSLKREVVRNRWAEGISAILIGVGGALVSYALEQGWKNTGMVMAILGAGFLILNLCTGLIAVLMVGWNKRDNQD